MIVRVVATNPREVRQLAYCHDALVAPRVDHRGPRQPDVGDRGAGERGQVITQQPWRRDWESNGDSDDSCTDDLTWFCGCGDPEHAAQYLRSVLDNVDGYRRGELDYDMFHQFERHFFPHYGAAVLVYHLLSHVGLMDHGSAVPGWLTDDGRALLAKLQAAPLGRDQEVAK